MKLSELVDERLQAQASGNGEVLSALSQTVYGVEIDPEFVSFDPPHGITEIGLITRFNDGEFTDEVLDLTTAYQMAVARPSVLLEIPAEEDIGSIRHVVSTVENLKASASFLPPENLDDEGFEAYCQRLEAVAAEWVSRLGFATMILPVTSYFQHMIVELIDPALGASFVPDDAYILERFHSRIPVEKSDAMKARIRKVIREAFTDDDGVDRFDEAMLVLCQRQLGDIEKVTAELAQNFEPPAPIAGEVPQTKTPRRKKPSVAKTGKSGKKPVRKAAKSKKPTKARDKVADKTGKTAAKKTATSPSRKPASRKPVSE
jgi:hypothetical protein|nr:hypothetical protein [Neorhizobium tomejilense]